MSLIESIIGGAAVTAAAVPVGFYARRWMALRRLQANPLVRLGADIREAITPEGAVVLEDVKIVRLAKGRIWLSGEGSLYSLPALKFDRLYVAFAPGPPKQGWET